MFSFSKMKSVAVLVSGVAVVMVNETNMSAVALQIQSDVSVGAEGDGPRMPDLKTSAQTFDDSAANTRAAIEEAIQSCEGNHGDYNGNLIQALRVTLTKYSLLDGDMGSNVNQLDNMPGVAADLKAQLDDESKTLAQKTDAILEYWNRLPELLQGRGIVAYCDPFKNGVEQAISRCNDDYGFANSNLLREIGAGLDSKSRPDFNVVGWLGTMPEVAADLQHRLIFASRLCQKTDAVMKFFERVPELREGRGVVTSFDRVKIAIEQAVEEI